MQSRFVFERLTLADSRRQPFIDKFLIASACNWLVLWPRWAYYPCSIEVKWQSLEKDSVFFKKSLWKPPIVKNVVECRLAVSRLESTDYPLICPFGSKLVLQHKRTGISEQLPIVDLGERPCWCYATGLVWYRNDRHTHRLGLESWSYLLDSCCALEEGVIAISAWNREKCSRPLLLLGRFRLCHIAINANLLCCISSLFATSARHKMWILF